MSKTKKKNRGTVISFLAPALVIYSVFLILPMIQTLYYSFTQWNGVSDKVFVGIRNYAEMFQDKDYWTVFKNTIELVALSLVIQMGLGLLIAFLLYDKMRFGKIFRTIYFLPVVIAPVAIGLMFSLFYNSEIGVFNKILAAIGLESLQTNWLSNIKTLLYAVMAPQIWQYIGLYITIFLGALQSIPNEIMESAEIDGANKRQTFWRIVLPSIRNFVFICMILCITGSLKSFDHSWVMTKGGPGVRSAYLGVLMYKTSFVNSDFGMGSAVAMTIIFLSIAFSKILNYINNKAAD